MSSIGSKSMLQDEISPIHKACINGDMHAIKVIFKPNLKDKKDKVGNTPLILATIRHSYDVAKYLLDREADVTLVNDDGHTALFYAEQSNDIEIANLIKAYSYRYNSLQQKKPNYPESVYSESVRTYDDNYSTNFDDHLKYQQRQQEPQEQQEYIDADEFVEQRANRRINSSDPNATSNPCDESASSDGAFSEHSQFQEVWSSQQPLSQSQLNFRNRNVEIIDDDDYNNNRSRNQDYNIEVDLTDIQLDSGGNFRKSTASNLPGASFDFRNSPVGSVYGGGNTPAGFRRSEVMRTSAQSRPGGFGVNSSITGRSISSGKGFRASSSSNLEVYYSENHKLNDFQSPNPMLSQRSSPINSQQYHHQPQSQSQPQREFYPPERDDEFSYSGKKSGHPRYINSYSNDTDVLKSLAASRASGIRGTPLRSPLLPPRDDTHRVSQATYSGPPHRGQATRVQESLLRRDDDDNSRRSQARSVAKSTSGKPSTVRSSHISLAQEETEHFYRNEVVPFGGPVSRSEWIEHLHSRIGQLKEFIAENDVKSPGLLRLLELSEVDLAELEAAPEGELALVKTATTANDLFDFGKGVRHDANNYDDIYRHEGQITKTEPGVAIFWDRRLSNLQFRVQRLWKSMETDPDGDHELDESDWDELSGRNYDMKIASENIDSSPYLHSGKSHQEYSGGYSSNTYADGYAGPTEIYSNDSARYGKPYGDPMQANTARTSVQSKRSFTRSDMDHNSNFNSNSNNNNTYNGNISELEEREIRMRRGFNPNASSSGLSVTSAWSGVGERLRGLTNRVQGEQDFVRRSQLQQKEDIDDLEDRVREKLIERDEQDELSYRRSISSGTSYRGAGGMGGNGNRGGGGGNTGIDQRYDNSLDIGRPPKNPLRGNNMSDSREINPNLRLRADSAQSGGASHMIPPGGDHSRSYSNLSGSRASGYGRDSNRVWDITSDLTESDTESFRWIRNEGDQGQLQGGGVNVSGSRNITGRSYAGDFDRNGILTTRLTGISEGNEDDVNHPGHEIPYEHRGRSMQPEEVEVVVDRERGRDDVPYTYDPQILTVLQNQEEHHHVQSRLISMQQSLDYSKESRSLDNRLNERRALERVSADLSVPSYSGSEPDVSRKIRSPFDSVSIHSGNRPMGGGGRSVPQEYTSIPAEKYSIGGNNGALDSNIFSATQTSSPLLDTTRFRNPPQPPYSAHGAMEQNNPYPRNSDEDLVRSDTVSVHRRPHSDFEEASVRVASVSRNFHPAYADGEYINEFEEEDDNGELGSPPRATTQHTRRRVYRRTSRDDGDPEPYQERNSHSDYSNKSFYEERQYNEQDYGLIDEEYVEKLDYYSNQQTYDNGHNPQVFQEYHPAAGDRLDWEEEERGRGRRDERVTGTRTDGVDDYIDNNSVAGTYTSKRSNYSVTSNKNGNHR